MQELVEWLKNKLRRGQQTRCAIKVEWRFDPGYICNFRRRVARVWAQTACRANSQKRTAEALPLKPNMPLKGCHPQMDF